MIGRTYTGWMTGFAAVAVVAAALTPVFAGHHDHGDKKGDKGKAYGKQDIVGVAASNDDFSTLVAAIKAAGLVETLKGDGPFTVFAPTNAAFAKLPEGTLDDLLKPENKDQLVAILTYHVASGRLKAKQVASQSEIETVQGQTLKVKTTDGKVMINNATVTATDIMARNGVIHVIDTVVLPTSE